MLLLAVVPLLTSTARAADPQPYGVEFAGTGDGALDDALKTSSELESLRKTAPVSPFALIARARQERERLRTVTESFGYYAAVIDISIEGHDLDDAELPTVLEGLPSDHDASVKVVVMRGPLYYLRRIDIEGLVDPAAQARLDLEPGAPAVAQQVLDARGRLLTALQEQGYAFAQVDVPIAELAADEPVLDVIFKVTTGPQVRVGDIRIVGLKSVHEAAARNRVQLRRDELYDPRKIDATRRALLGLGVFSGVTVSLGDTPEADGTIPVTFQVTERPRRVVRLTAAYSTDLGGNVGATWWDRNLLGSAEQLTLSANAINLGGRATTGLGYDTRAELTKPDFLHLDQTLQLSIEALQQSLTAYDRKAVLTGAQLTRKLSALWTASAGLTLQRERITQQSLTRDYTLLALPLTARYDTTGQSNPLEDPRRGWRASVNVAPTESLAVPRETFVVVQGTVSTYIDLGGRSRPGRSILALRAAAANAYGSGQFSLPPDQRFYGGGSATVRGYRYQTIGPLFPDGTPAGGTALAAGTVELRQRIGRSFGAAAFVDAGKVTATTQPWSGTFSVGVGVGVRYYTPIGPVRLDVGVPTHRLPGGDKFEIYIGLGQVF
jgi:translocation and assembly module TamA